MALSSQRLLASPPASGHEHTTDLLVLLAAACSVGAAGIHFAVVPEHLVEYRPFGLFFVAIAVVQALWAILVVRYPLRPLLLVGAVANLATLAHMFIAERSATFETRARSPAGAPLPADSGRIVRCRA